jgi:hypothetical protein
MPIVYHKLSQDGSECKLNNVFCQQRYFIDSRWLEGIRVESALFLLNRSDLLKRWYNGSTFMRHKMYPLDISYIHRRLKGKHDLRLEHMLSGFILASIITRRCHYSLVAHIST